MPYIEFLLPERYVLYVSIAIEHEDKFPQVISFVYMTE